MNTNGNEKDSDESKEDNGVDQYGDATRTHVTEVHHSAVARQLEQQPRRQHHKEHHSYQNRSPICHRSYTFLSSCTYKQHY